jgi:hypothetical protein
VRQIMTKDGGILIANNDSVYAQAKRILDELDCDPGFQRHLIRELSEDEIRAWFMLVHRKGEPT